MKFRGLFLFLFILISLNFVFGVSIEDVESLIDQEKAQLQGQGIEYIIFNEAETRENGAVVSIKIVDEDGSFCVRGNCYENIDKSKTNYFDLDAEGNIVSASFVTTGEGNYTLGEDEYFLPKGTSVEFRGGKVVFVGNGDVVINTKENKKFNLLLNPGVNVEVEFLERGKMVFSGRVFTINGYSGGSLSSEEQISIIFDNLGRVLRVEGKGFMLGDVRDFSLNNKDYLNFYYGADFNISAHKDENYFYEDLTSGVLYAGGDYYLTEHYVTRSGFKSIFSLVPNGNVEISKGRGLARVLCEGSTIINSGYFNTLRISEDGKIFKRFNRGSFFGKSEEEINQEEIDLEVVVKSGDESSNLNYDGTNNVYSSEGEDFSLYSLPARDTIEASDERLNKFEDRERDKQYFLEHGITPELERGYVPKVSEWWQENFNPAGDYVYDLATQDPIQFIRNFNDRFKRGATAFTQGTSTGREDAWRLYLGMPQQDNTFSISKYQPSISSENRYYYKINEFSEFENVQQVLYRISQGGKSRINVDSVVIPDMGGAEGGVGLRDYTLSKGKDSCGFYISYYDKWDLTPNKLEGFFGTPLEIYDRIYYDPITYEKIENPCGN